MLRKPDLDVAALISTLDEGKREASWIDEPWVVNRLVAIVEQSMLGQPRTNGLGDPIIDHRSGGPIVDTDNTHANRAFATTLSGVHSYC